MKSSILDQKHFFNEKAAFKYVESIIWKDGKKCPHCGNTGKIYELKGKSARAGLNKCGECKKEFTVRIGTIFEDSKIPLHKWLQAFYLICSSKKGCSSHQIHRTLEITYKSAWFLTHRIRECAKASGIEIVGGEDKIVEVDETFIGNVGKHRHRGGPWHKEKVFSLIERGGKVRSQHVEFVNAKTLLPILKENVAQETTIMTDDAGQYRHLRRDYFKEHHVIAHKQKEYVRGEVHTNTIEGFFSIFKRGMKGVYQHCGKRHLQRYLREFDFRYNTRKVSDNERTALLLGRAVGKRLTYSRTC
jgi:transposase-like protein